ncbi:MAG: efflux RND transporter periplasmic adaptor subunit [Syntrophales bacterium]|jgi:membrane fusion protein (multidrug efflux system)|nr:efflux RND transporter periplasmic adaptor subunit [Syntrophales bacterium]MCK9527920.1 efflux RND transporter periplasmic adaptor subunit [Syntrophales bacterium]MDX9921904.1 efflux RND transporter periplasmic adaptor subunit [Syntrophales bacterium]
MSRFPQILVYGVIVVVFSLAAAGCGNNNEDVILPPPEVAVVTIEQQPVVMTTELPGRTSSYLTAEVRPQVSGIIQKRLFTEGSDVEAGQPLFQIDPALFEAALARAEANLTTLELKAGRMQRLLDNKAVSRQAYDDITAALKQARAEAQTARINLKYTTITAPISGRIGRSSVTVGALVTAHQPVALATIRQLDPMYVDVTQSTADIQRLRLLLQSGELTRNNTDLQSVRLVLGDGTPYPLTGTLQFRDVSVDPTTGSVILRIVFPNPGEILLPGMFVRAVLKEGVNEKAILIPQQSVSRNPKGEPFVFIVDEEGKAQLRYVTLDREIGTSWLVRSGLVPDEKVIVEGMLRVTPGIGVNAVPFDEEKADSSAEAADRTKQ